MPIEAKRVPQYYDAMKLNFRFLGRFSEDLAGIALPEEFTEGLDVKALRCLVADIVPSSAPRIQSCMIAVNTEYVDNNHVLEPGDEVAFLPPVSGG